MLTHADAIYARGVLVAFLISLRFMIRARIMNIHGALARAAKFRFVQIVT